MKYCVKYIDLHDSKRVPIDSFDVPGLVRSAHIVTVPDSPSILPAERGHLSVKYQLMIIYHDNGPEN